jgi:RNA polymerase sigma factor (sigma-70 family)
MIMAEQDETPRIPQLPMNHHFDETEIKKFYDNEKLVGYMITVAHKPIRVLKGKGYTKDDIYQIGCFGLLSACQNKNFDSILGEFSTYACRCIYNAYLIELNKLMKYERIAPKSNFDYDYYIDKQIIPKSNTSLITNEALILVIDMLTVREKYLIYQYYELELTMQAIANKYKLSKERIRQKLVVVINKLREKLNVESNP